MSALVGFNTRTNQVHKWSQSYFVSQILRSLHRSTKETPQNLSSSALRSLILYH